MNGTHLIAENFVTRMANRFTFEAGQKGFFYSYHTVNLDSEQHPELALRQAVEDHFLEIEKLIKRTAAYGHLNAVLNRYARLLDTKGISPRTYQPLLRMIHARAFALMVRGIVSMLARHPMSKAICYTRDREEHSVHIKHFLWTRIEDVIISHAARCNFGGSAHLYRLEYEVCNEITGGLWSDPDAFTAWAEEWERRDATSAA